MYNSQTAPGGRDNNRLKCIASHITMLNNECGHKGIQLRFTYMAYFKLFTAQEKGTEKGFSKMHKSQINHVISDGFTLEQKCYSTLDIGLTIKV